MRVRYGCLGLVFVSAVLCAGLLRFRPRSVAGGDPVADATAPPAPTRTIPSPTKPTEPAEATDASADLSSAPTAQKPLPPACAALEYASPLDTLEDLSAREAFILSSAAGLSFVERSTGFDPASALENNPEMALALAEGAASIDTTLGLVTLMTLLSSRESVPEPEDALRSRLARWSDRGRGQLGDQLAFVLASTPHDRSEQAEARALVRIAPRLVHPLLQRMALLRSNEDNADHRRALAAMPIRDPRFAACRDARLARPLDDGEDPGPAPE
ncbi:MAG: hypothetical protein AAF211_04005 [Myxococcota bacterium]